MNMETMKRGLLRIYCLGYLQSDPNPTGESLALLAQLSGYTLEEVHREVFAIAAEMAAFLASGRHTELNQEPDPEQVRQGMEIEKEHTSNALIAQKIALDHLVEHPDYYTKLKAAKL